MPLLGPADPLPHVPRRVLVAGNAGSGKSTLCLRIAQRRDLRRVELDRLYWGPQWTPRPEFPDDGDGTTGWSHGQTARTTGEVVER